MNQKLFVLTAVAALALTACDEDTTEPVLETLDLSFSGLEALANGYHYEG